MKRKNISPVMLVMSALMTIMLLFPPLAWSQIEASSELQGEWRPAIPKPKDFDWIRLTSDEWLKGDLIAMYDDELEFDSDELGLLTLDWDDIAEVLTHGSQSVRLLDGRILEGRLHIVGEKLSLVNGGVQELDRYQILAIASSKSGESDYWSGNVSLGVNARNGNTNQKDYTGEAEIKRRTTRSRLIAAYLASYSAIDDEATENNQRLNVSFDWFVSHKIFFRALTLEYFRDPFQNINSRSTVSSELGYRFYDNSLIYWDIAGGPGYQQTQFESVEAGEDDKENTATGKISTDFEWDITGDIEYDFHYDVQLVSERAGEKIHHMKTSIEFELTNDFDLEISYIWDRVEKPLADAAGITPKQEDSRFVIGLGYEF